jgi:tetratricopeptide (TPR) repeat protein
MGFFDWLRRRRSGKGKAAGEPTADREADDARLVDQAVRFIQEREPEQARQLLLSVVSRAPAQYEQQFESGGKLHIKFWDMQEFLSWVAWMKDNGPERDVVWVLSAYPRAYYYLGYLALEAGDFTGAIDFLDRGLSLEPGNAKLTCEKARALIRLKRHRDALALYTDVLTRTGFLSEPDRARALRGQGYVLIELGDLDAAEQSFRRSQDYEPDSPVANQELQSITQLRGRGGVAARLGISEEQFNVWYESYRMALSLSGKDSDWNDDIDGLARTVGALTEEEIEAARTDFNQAVINRIKMRLAMPRMEGP